MFVNFGLITCFHYIFARCVIHDHLRYQFSGVMQVFKYVQNYLLCTKKLIRRWDTERGRFYDDIIYVQQNTEKRTYFF